MPVHDDPAKRGVPIDTKSRSMQTSKKYELLQMKLQTTVIKRL
jgi:hypothetical protein